MVTPLIGPYRILEKLGSGGMGDVYLAEDTRLNRRVALKTLADPALNSPEGRRRLRHEARAAAALNHPNIAAVYDVLESQDGAHIVMEYVQGENLAQRLRQGALRPAAVLDIAVQLADALAAAHAAGVIHRDLKPGNVVMTADGKVKVLDFGLAKTRFTANSGGGSAGAALPASLSYSGAREDGQRMIGTPPYMSPEQFLGQPVDARSDVYCLGVLLYELLTGRRPFEGADVTTLAMAVLTETPPAVRELNPSIPAAVDAAVMRAMAREPGKRYATAAEMLADLQRVQASLTDAPTASVAWRVAPSSRGRPAPIVAAIGALIVMIAVVVWKLIPKGNPPAAKPTVVAVLPLASATGDPTDEYIGTGIADVLISALSKVPAVTAVARSATLPYRGPDRDLRRAARELGATLLVDGSVQKAQARVRVTLALVDAATLRVAWSDSYDGDLAEVFTLQERLGTAVARAVQRPLTPDERNALQSTPTRSTRAFSDYAQARALLERPDVRGNVDRAIVLLQSAVGQDPGFALAHAALSEACWAKYQESSDPVWTTRARDAALEALRLDPAQAQVRVSLAVVYQGTGRPREAIDELRRAIELQPRNDDAHRLLGDLLADEGRTEEAIAALETAIALRPDYWRNYSFLGRFYFRTGRYPEAIQAFSHMVELQPDNAWAVQMLGTAYHAAGDTSRALEYYRRSIELAPDARAYTNMGNIHYAEGRYREALSAFQEAVRLDPRSPLKHRNLGDVLRKLGRPQDAARAYERAAELGRERLAVNPSDPQALAHLAVVEAKLGRRREARQAAEKAAALPGADGEAFYCKAVVHALAGEDPQALSELKRAIAHGWSAELAADDEDLESLRDHPEFKALLARRAGGEKESVR